MPELPEVETTRKGLYHHIIARKISKFSHDGLALRKPLSLPDRQAMIGHTITDIRRRGKYLIVATSHQNLDILIHLGMSGSLRVASECEPLKKHDHVAIELDEEIELRFHDPRRFGFVMPFLRATPPQELTHLGVEPLSDAFNAQYLYQRTRHKKRAIKDFIMDQSHVVGVGNIYATEALFDSGIHPSTPANTLSQIACERLCEAIKVVLSNAIEAGGTTLRDFVRSDGQPGYFKQTLQVYGRVGEDCKRCGQTITKQVIGGRNSAFCPHCQQM